MKDVQDDSTLRPRFQKLGNEDRAHAPSFHHILGRQVPRQTRVSKMRIAAAVVLLVLTFAILLNLPDPRPSAPAPGPAGRFAPSISEWQAPTDALLITPGGELLTTVPSLHLTLGAATSRDSTTSTTSTTGRPL